VTLVIGLLTVELLISASLSLKDKRNVLDSVKRKLQHKFNVSIAEIDYKDLWNKSVLAIVMVSDSTIVVDSHLQYVLNFIEKLREIEVLSVRRENF
jgi:uncharacterized protein YlxP (DUF503 family)